MSKGVTYTQQDQVPRDPRTFAGIERYGIREWGQDVGLFGVKQMAHAQNSPVTVPVERDSLTALLSAAQEVAEDLGAELADRYGPEPRSPSEARRYARDLEPVTRLNGLVAEIRSRTPELGSVAP